MYSHCFAYHVCLLYYRVCLIWCAATGMAIDENRLGSMDAAAGAVAVAAAEASDALAGENGDGDEDEEESEADRAAAEAQRVAEQYSRHSWELLVRLFVRCCGDDG